MKNSTVKSWLLATGLLAFASGCGNNCTTRGAEPIEFNGGRATSALTWETGALFGEEYLHFVPGRRFDLMHRLGAMPVTPASWVSFAREPSKRSNDEENIGNVAESAGNQVVIECADEERVRVRNDTCAEFYLRVVITVDPNAGPAKQPCL